MASTKKEIAKNRAKQIFLSGKYQQKEIAEMVGVAENTIKRWKDAGNWETLRANLTTTKESVLSQLYAQLSAINQNIESREEPERFANTKEADSIVKLSTAIKKLETETGIAEIANVSIGLCEFVRQYSLEEAQRISDHLNAYIEHKMK